MDDLTLTSQVFPWFFPHISYNLPYQYTQLFVVFIITLIDNQCCSQGYREFIYNRLVVATVWSDAIYLRALHYYFLIYSYISFSYIFLLSHIFSCFLIYFCTTRRKPQDCYHAGCTYIASYVVKLLK